MLHMVGSKALGLNLSIFKFIFIEFPSSWLHKLLRVWQIETLPVEKKLCCLQIKVAYEVIDNFVIKISSKDFCFVPTTELPSMKITNDR